MVPLVNRRVWCTFLVVLVVSLMTLSYVSLALTDPGDTAALISLYVSLDSPPLKGWVPTGGDPCGMEWEGVKCLFSSVTALKLSGLELRGKLSDNLYLFSSIIEIDLSNNSIGGSIPAKLPSTLRNFSLAGNKVNGIPATLASLPKLLDLQLNDNHLRGEIPDVLEPMTSLFNLDLSGNNLTGKLPLSMANLTSITSLYLQNNNLVGDLGVLQDLPLEHLNVENNLFSGYIPPKLLKIPDFRRNGNQLNETTLPPPPTASPPSGSKPPSPPSPPPPKEPPARNQTDAHSDSSNEGKKFFTTRNIVLFCLVGAIVFVVLALVLVLLRSKFRQWKEDDVKRRDFPAIGIRKEDIPRDDKREQDNQFAPRNSLSIVPTESIVGFQGQQESFNLKQPRPYLPPTYTGARKSLSSSTTSVFTIATLQQYTNSFSEETFIGEGTLGSVYRADLPDGTLLAVKKLNTRVSRQQSDKDFLNLVSSVSKIQHPNIVKLVGYCNEHGQRLLVYEFCEYGTLHDALHLDDEIRKTLSWNKRIQLALGAASALQYLHEVCQPPMVHRNFKSANVVIDDKLCARVADCGLTTEHASSTLAYGCGAPELESESYTCKSDVYSFGIVMLELVTGRKSYDRSLNLGEQSLVRWAVPQLHDIDSLARMVDPSLHGTYSIKSLSRFADIISKCLQTEPEFRPSMSQVVQDLMEMI